MKALAKGEEHLGRGRTSSEDVFRIYDELGLYIVCDASRDADGRWAAESVCDTLHRVLQSESRLLAEYKTKPSRENRLKIEGLLHHAVQLASALIYKNVVKDHARVVSSLSLDAILFLGDYAICAHVGNTRLYLVREGKVALLTRDHTYYHEMLKTALPGTKINPSFKKRLSRSLGLEESVPLTPLPVLMAPGDLLVICSDGVSDYLGEGAKTLLELTQDRDPAVTASKLASYALKQGSDDNTTVVVVGIQQDESLTRTLAIPQNSKRQLELLRSVQVFSSLREDPTSLLKIQNLLTFRSAVAGDVLLQEGAPSDEMFILLSGGVDVVAQGKKIAHRKKNDVIGEMGFFTRELRSATIVATEPTEFMSIQRWDYEAVVEKDWRLGYRLLEAVVGQLAERVRRG